MARGSASPCSTPRKTRHCSRAKTVWIGFRVFYGFLHREDMRRTEAAELQFKDVDLDQETIALDENKTDNPRRWKLSPGVADALRAWRDLRNAEDDHLVFIDENGGALELNHLANRTREHLATAGLTRADLTSTGELKHLRTALLPPLLRHPFACARQE